MAHAPEPSKSELGFVYRHPGIISAIVAIVIAVGFVAALYVSADSHPKSGAAAHH